MAVSSRRHHYSDFFSSGGPVHGVLHRATGVVAVDAGATIGASRVHVACGALGTGGVARQEQQSNLVFRGADSPIVAQFGLLVKLVSQASV